MGKALARYAMKDVFLVVDPRFERLFPSVSANNVLRIASRNRSNLRVIKVLAKLIALLITRKPKVVVFAGVATKTPFVLDVVTFFIVCKRFGFFREKRILVWVNKTFESEKGRIVGRIQTHHLKRIDKIITYYKSSTEHLDAEHEGKFTFVPLPAFHVNQTRPQQAMKPYVFSGGESQRDFASLVSAIRSFPVNLIISTLGVGEQHLDQSQLPKGVCVKVGDRFNKGPEEYLSDLAGATVVVVPLLETNDPKGLTTIVEALVYGKAIISTRSRGLDDYLQHGYNCLRVEAGNSRAYATAIKQLWTNDQLRTELERGARATAKRLRVEYFDYEIKKIVTSLQEQPLG